MFRAGMNVWGVSKLHMAADRLGVPLWIVDLRYYFSEPVFALKIVCKYA